MGQVIGKLECDYTPPAWRGAIRKLRAALPKGARTQKPNTNYVGPFRLVGHYIMFEQYDIEAGMVRGRAIVYYTVREKKKAKR